MGEKTGSLSGYTGSPLVLYNAECKSGGVQKLSKAVFCTRPAEEKLTILTGSDEKTIREFRKTKYPNQGLLF